jgi:hypothetical protein
MTGTTEYPRMTEHQAHALAAALCEAGQSQTIFTAFVTDRWNGTLVSARADLNLIHAAWGEIDFEAEADGFGAGCGTYGDWSAIRDSSDEALALMLPKALAWWKATLPEPEPQPELVGRCRWCEERFDLEGSGSAYCSDFCSVAHRCDSFS